MACGDERHYEMTDGKDQLEIGLAAMEGLLGEFRAGNIRQPALEKAGLGRHLREISRRWNEKFPGLPEEPFVYSSLKGISRKERRDAYLKQIIVKLLAGCEGGTIVEPACLWGIHSRDLARCLPHHRVLGTDIQGKANWLYGHIPWTRTPATYQFRRDDIFNPNVQGEPSAVFFYGACASLSDAAMDYVIGSHCPLLVCMACCHAFIGGNSDIVKPNFMTRVYLFLLAKRGLMTGFKRLHCEFEAYDLRWDAKTPEGIFDPDIPGGYTDITMTNLNPEETKASLNDLL